MAEDYTFICEAARKFASEASSDVGSVLSDLVAAIETQAAEIEELVSANDGLEDDLVQARDEIQRMSRLATKIGTDMRDNLNNAARQMRVDMDELQE